MNFPDYHDLDLCKEPLWHGYYTLGLITRYRPDVAMIPFRLSRQDRWIDQDLNADLLRKKIDEELASGKKILIVPWEEDFMGQKEDAITACFNQYANEDFWLVSEMDHAGQDIFRRYHELTCKILELPFVIVNDAIVYSKIRKTFDPEMALRSDFNYLCMVGRPEKHKFDLLVALKNHDLHDYGYLTFIGTNNRYNQGLSSFVKINHHLPRYDIPKLLTDHRKESAQIKIAGIWASSNVENFLHIESTYDMPLIINPESTMGIFPATEKSIWPALLGRMYLIQSQPGAMKYVQQFHDIDQSRWADLSFDSVHGWDDDAHWHRRNAMIKNNEKLIKNSREIYQDLQQDLTKARWTFAENIYRFFLSKLNII